MVDSDRFVVEQRRAVSLREARVLIATIEIELAAIVMPTQITFH